MTEYLFVGGPFHGTMREVDDERGFVSYERDPATGFEESGEAAYTKRGVYLDFDDVRCVRQVFVFDGEDMHMRRVFDAALRLFFRGGKHVTLPTSDPFVTLFGAHRTPFDGPPEVRRAN